MIGHADLQLGEAVDDLRAAGHTELADRLEREIVGRNVVEGRWTFQLVDEFDEFDEFDEGYWTSVRDFERDACDGLVAGRRHVFESEMKEQR